jgi:hypothetical protein
MNKSIEFKEYFHVIRMWVERDCSPFDEYVVGYFDKNDEGYYVFNPSGVAMTCKYLKFAAEKASDLNKGIG